jgi:rSAM/selenodomain-associated transferase 2
MNSGVALIVPVLDDDAAVAALLAQIAHWSKVPQEIVIVSGRKAGAELTRLCSIHDCRLLETDANRGAQLDLGAAAARAPLLWFLHADTQPSRDSLALIEAAHAAGAESGCFRFDFQGPRRWHKRLLAKLVAWRIRAGGIPYGDQSLFVSREIYEQCGGFPHQPLFEEVRLIKRLRRRGTFRALSTPIQVSTRRWDRDGWWSRSCHNRWLALRYMLGESAERLASAYTKTPPRAANSRLEKRTPQIHSRPKGRL